MRIKEIVENALSKRGLFPDKFTYCKGVFTYKESYFYTFENSPRKIADKIMAALPKITIIDTENQWRHWPKTSWFIVKFSQRQ